MWEASQTDQTSLNLSAKGVIMLCVPQTQTIQTTKMIIYYNLLARFKFSLQHNEHLRHSAHLSSAVWLSDVSVGFLNAECEQVCMCVWVGCGAPSANVSVTCYKLTSLLPWTPSAEKYQWATKMGARQRESQTARQRGRRRWDGGRCSPCMY